MRHWRWDWNGTMAWMMWSLLIVALATGCHSDTNQGGGADKGHAVPAGTPQQTQQAVPTPPSADRIDPNSPQAVLHGTTTTKSQTQPSR